MKHCYADTFFEYMLVTTLENNHSLKRGAWFSQLNQFHHRGCPEGAFQ